MLYRVCQEHHSHHCCGEYVIEGERERVREGERERARARGVEVVLPHSFQCANSAIPANAVCVREREWERKRESMLACGVEAVLPPDRVTLNRVRQECHSSQRYCVYATEQEKDRAHGRRNSVKQSQLYQVCQECQECHSRQHCGVYVKT